MTETVVEPYARRDEGLIVRSWISNTVLQQVCIGFLFCSSCSSRHQFCCVVGCPAILVPCLDRSF